MGENVLLKSIGELTVAEYVSCFGSLVTCCYSEIIGSSRRNTEINTRWPGDCEYSVVSRRTLV